MENTVTIYRITTFDTYRLGAPPAYVFDEPEIGSAQRFEDGMDYEPVTIHIPDGYSIRESKIGEHYLYDPRGEHVPVFDHNGHPAVCINYPGTTHLDKIDSENE
ncbi:MAG: hypothetical protein VB062_04525 [Christensenella sp.]|nr:hypothetical protein [Christensenella sp.]